MNIKIGAKQTIGVLLIIIGLLALVTSLTPGSGLMFVGLELLGLECYFGIKYNQRSRFYKNLRKEV